MSAPREVAVGLRFRYPIADEKPVIEVREFLAKNYWECEVLDGDHRADLRAYSDFQILSGFHIDEIFGGYDPANYVPAEDEDDL